MVLPNEGSIGRRNHQDMSIRMYLIGQALTGLCANNDYVSYVQVAEEAIKVADEVLRRIDEERR